MGPEKIKTLILCGGRGTRAHPQTLEVPKPLLDLGGRPVLQHVMEIYALQGFQRFVLSAGFKCELIEEFASTLTNGWEIEVVDTGLDTETGDRIAQCRDRLGDTFFATYADGLADIDLYALLACHHSHPGAATITCVRLRCPYGTVESDEDGRVRRFREKPVLDDHLINGGFFVVDARAFGFWKGRDLEREVLPALGAMGELYSYRHNGFWRSMDTLKDVLDLSTLCTKEHADELGRPPWLRFATHASS